jgi:hypothetical protein
MKRRMGKGMPSVPRSPRRGWIAPRQANEPHAVDPHSARLWLGLRLRHSSCLARGDVFEPGGSRVRLQSSQCEGRLTARRGPSGAVGASRPLLSIGWQARTPLSLPSAAAVPSPPFAVDLPLALQTPPGFRHAYSIPSARLPLAPDRRQSGRCDRLFAHFTLLSTGGVSNCGGHGHPRRKG